MEDFLHSPSSIDTTKKNPQTVREMLSQLMAIVGNCKRVLSSASLASGCCILH